MQGMTHPLVIRESRWPSHVPAKSFAGVSSTYHRWPWAWTNSKLLVPKNNWPFNICQCLCFCTLSQIWWSKLSLIRCEEAHQLLMTILMSVNHPNKKANYLFTDILSIHQLYDAKIRVAYITRHGASDSNKSMVIREREWPSDALGTSFAST